MPRGSKPGERRGGRKKGTPNKLTASVKELLLGALDDVGGREYLVTQARDNPTAFMTMLGKVLPTQVTGDPDNPMVSKVIFEVIDSED